MNTTATTANYRIWNRRTNRSEYEAESFEQVLNTYDNWSDDLDGYEGNYQIEKYNEHHNIWVIF